MSVDNTTIEAPQDITLETLEAPQETSLEVETTEPAETPADHPAVSRRINRLTSKLSKREEELAALQAKLAELEAAQAKPVVEVATKPTRDAFETDDAFEDALADWKITEKQKLELAEAKAREHNDIQGAYNARVATFKARHADFEEAVQEVVPTFDGDNLSIAYIIESDLGPEVVYALANDAELCEKFAKLRPSKRVLELAKLELKLTKQKDTASKLAEKPKPVEVPKPTVKVSAVASVERDLKDLSPAEYRKVRMAQLKKGK